MTVITLSTVGYTERIGFTDYGRAFAIFFILVSLVIVAIVIRFIVESLLSKWNFDFWKNKKNRIMIKNLNEHTIVCGFGRNGRQAVRRLQHHGTSYIVIEQDEELIAEYEEQVLFYQGNALSDHILQAVAIERAKNLICSLPNDADNLFVVL